MTCLYLTNRRGRELTGGRGEGGEVVADNDESKKRARPARDGGERCTEASVVPDSSRFCRGFDVYFARTFFTVAIYSLSLSD